jgi:hypothetical protein
VSEHDPSEAADQLEREADDLAGRSRDLHAQARDVSQDWERKRSSGDVPGAQPDQPDEGEMDARERGEPVKEPSGEGDRS